MAILSAPTRSLPLEPPALGAGPWLVPGLVVLIGWLQLVTKMSVDWSTNGQYEFGFFVPLFVAFLLYLRWRDRPEPGSVPSLAWAHISSVFLLCAIFAIRLTQEANPDWRPLNWVHATAVAVLTLIPVYIGGGWPWVRHFAPPLGLIYMALPWPLAIEQGVIQFLARGVSSVTTELLNWTGIPALRIGNVIEVPTGPVGVQDACTGIRSLAGSLMSGVFFGEYYRFRFSGRIWLVLGGVLAALVLNLVRTYFLCWVAATRGIEAISQWHDQAGLVIFCAAFAALWLLAEYLYDDNHVEQQTASNKGPLSSPKATFAIVALSMLVAGEIAKSGWYWFHERGESRTVSWKPVWPTPESGFRFLPVADQARAILRYSEGYSAEMPFSDGHSWQVYFFRWEPGRSSSQLAVLHRPEICLPAAGFKMLGASEPLNVTIDGLTVPFQSSIYETGGKKLFVFRTLWEERPITDDLLTQGFDQSVRGRLSSVLHGRRNRGQQLLQVGVSGMRDEEAARADLLSRLPGMLTVNR